MSVDYVSAWAQAGAEIHSPTPGQESTARATRPLGGRPRALPETSTEAPLGKHWEIIAPPPSKSYPDSFEEKILIRIERYHLQAIAREILFDLEDAKGRKFAIRGCLRSLQADKQHVGVHRRDGKGFYTNLQTCGSVWGCPVCAAKISEGRRRDLSKGIERWKAAGGQVKHLIQTVPHHKGQSLAEVLEGIQKVREVMLHRKPWRRKIVPFLAGSVRALEVTYGENGWHVHIHELLFIKPIPDMWEWMNFVQHLGEIAGMWKDACLSVGLGEPHRLHGIRIQNGEYASEYAAKWGLDCELTKGHIKKAREGHTPWDMLREYRDGNTAYKDLFREYALAFKGRRQLRWSKDLKALLGIEDASDEELAARKEAGEELGALDLDIWRLVVKAKKRGELAAIAGASGWEGVVSFIRVLQLQWSSRNEGSSAQVKGGRVERNPSGAVPWTGGV